MIHKILFGNNKNILKRSYIYNMIAGVINALKAVILLMIVTRITGLEDAGILTLAFAVSNLLVTIGKFGVRNYQVTDINCKFNFSNYLQARIFSVLLMIACSIIYCVYSFIYLNTNINKVIVIFIICIINAVEAMEDVFGGKYQKDGRLDVASIIFCIRWIITVICFGIALYITKNLLISSLIALLTTLIISIVLVSISSTNFEFNTVQNHDLKKLLKYCFPLFAGAFFMIYLTNSPKYAIEMYLSDEIQACYGFVSMPIFVIELLNNFLYQPKLVKIADCWETGKLYVFKKYIFKQCITLIILTFICIVGASIFGIPILSLLYDTNLSEYKMVLLIVLVGGGLLAFTGFFAVLLTVMRRQNWMMYCYIAVSVFSIIFMNLAVSSYGLLGGAILFDILIFILSGTLLLCVFYAYRKKQNIIRGGYK